MTLPRIIGLWSPAPGCGKSTVARALGFEHGYVTVPFATPLKNMAITLLREAGYSALAAHEYVWHDKEATLELLPGTPTTRRVLQTLGSEWGRDCIHNSLWVELWKRQAADLFQIIADDLRFPNEAAAIRELGGELWCVTRPGFSDHSGHASESGLGDVTFDRIIVNDGTVDDLWEQVT